MYRPLATLSFFGTLVAAACSTVTDRTLSDAPVGGSDDAATGGVKGGAAGSAASAAGGKAGGSVSSAGDGSGGTGKGGTRGGGAGRDDTAGESNGAASGSAAEAGATTGGTGGTGGGGGTSATGGSAMGGSAADDGNAGDSGVAGGPATVTFGAPFPVVSTFDGPVAVAATSTAVVWLESNGVELCPAAGCGTNAPKHIVPIGLKDAPVASGLALALDSTYAYWLATRGGNVEVKRCPFTGCSTEPDIFMDPPAPFPLEGLLVANGTLYGHTYEGAYACAVSGCSRSADEAFYAPDAMQLYMTADDAGLYYSIGGEDHGTSYCDFADCPPDTLAPLLSLHGPIAASNGRVFELSDGTLATCPTSGCTSVPTPLATGLSNVTALAADASGVYWAIGGASGGVYTCERLACDGGPVTVASNQASPTSLALNAGYVYWVTSGSSAAVMASKKP